MTGLLRKQGWRVSHKRVERIWRQEGLKVPKRQPKRRRLWFDDGSCIRLRPQHPNHVWAYDFVADRTANGRPLKMLTVVDEFSRQCLVIHVARKLTSFDVLQILADLFLEHGPPAHIRSDYGPEFTAHLIRNLQRELGVATLSSEPGSPWENGYDESFNARLRDERGDGELFYTLAEACVVSERWRRHYNHVRPHSALGWRPPRTARPCARTIVSELRVN